MNEHWTLESMGGGDDEETEERVTDNKILINWRKKERERKERKRNEVRAECCECSKGKMTMEIMAADTKHYYYRRSLSKSAVAIAISHLHLNEQVCFNVFVPFDLSVKSVACGRRVWPLWLRAYVIHSQFWRLIFYLFNFPNFVCFVWIFSFSIPSVFWFSSHCSVDIRFDIKSRTVERRTRHVAEI